MHKALILILLALLTAACNQNISFSEYQSTSNGVWNLDDVKEFIVSDLDSVSQHQVFIMVRNDNSFPYSNLFLIAELNLPGGLTIKDTLEYEMAKANGEWLGKGRGSIYENKLWYKENVVFDSSGVYRVKISHAMRKNGEVEGVVNLPGITDVGLEIEKVE